MVWCSWPATNRLDGLDEALIREGRFDAKIRIDLPDEATRIKIFEAQLSKKPWNGFDVEEFARRTPGAARRQSKDQPRRLAEK